MIPSTAVLIADKAAPDVDFTVDEREVGPKTETEGKKRNHCSSG